VFAFLIAARFAAPIVSLPPYQFAKDKVLPAARARLRYARILRLGGEEVATRNKATLEQGPQERATTMRRNTVFHKPG
jgi:hypothetical protein